VARLRAFDYRQGQRLLFFDAPRPALGPTQPPTKWVSGGGGLPMGKADAEHSPPSSAEVKNERSYTSTPAFGFMACAGTTLPSLIKAQCGWTLPGLDKVAKRKICPCQKRKPVILGSFHGRVQVICREMTFSQWLI
jgi:hypothetical protein